MVESNPEHEYTHDYTYSIIKIKLIVLQIVHDVAGDRNNSERRTSKLCKFQLKPFFVLLNLKVRLIGL